MKQPNRACPIDCPIYLDTEIASSSDFLGVFSWTLDPNKRFWFRGHPRIEYTLALWRRGCTTVVAGRIWSIRGMGNGFP